MGPMLVLPGKPKSGPLPVEVLYGSQWRSGIIDRAGKSSIHLIIRIKQQTFTFNFILDLKKGLFPLSTPDLVEEKEDDQSDLNGKALKHKAFA